MAKRAHTSYTKNHYEQVDYKDMVKRPSKDLQDTNDNNSSIFEDTSSTINVLENEMGYTNKKVTPKPISTKFVEFITQHLIVITFSLMGVLATWNIYLQISDAVNKEKIDNIKEDIVTINSQIEDIKELYVRKDIFDLKFDNLKEKINELDKEIDKIE